MKNFRRQRKFYSQQKIRLSAKLTILLMLISFVQISVKAHSQDGKLDLNVQNVSISEVFEEIEDNSAYRFFYDNDLEDLSKEVTISTRQEEIAVVMRTLLEGTNLTYIVRDNFILVQLKSAKSNAQSMTRQKSISGTLTDENGEPLPGVTVFVKGTTNGTITDMDGKYIVPDVPVGATLVFSFIGMLSQEVEVGNQTTMNVIMLEETVGLDEVVVIGYGTQKKVNLTSAVQTVDAKDLENRPVKSVTEMLSASVPGLNITTASGAPNADSKLNIRGFTGFNASGTPLVLVDGVPQDIDLVNANDVESISVLKDAAASAIYGSRAPNGVILITTKSGKKGQKMQINFSADLIVSSPIGLPETVNSDVNATFRNNQRYNSLLSPLWNQEAIDRMTQYINGEITTTNIILPNGKYGGVYEYNANNDQMDNAFRDNVLNQKYNVSINGGSEKTTYYASIGFIDNEGVYDSPIDWMKRYSALVKINTDITDWLSVGVSSKYGRQQSSRPRIWRNGQNDGNFFDAVGSFTSLPSYDDNGSPNEFSILPNLTGASGSFDNTNDDLWLTGQFELKLIKGLSIKSDYTWNTNHQFDNNTSFVFNSWDADGTPKPSRRSPSINDIEERSKNKHYHNLNLVATYNLQINKHDLTLLTGYNEEELKFNSLYGYNSLFYTNSIPSLSTTYGDPKVDDAIYAWATQGYFGRLSYNFRGTYLLDINMRYDASSKYSPDTRWAFFPSISAGYNVARENFWPLKDHVNMFKVKASWGKLGNNTGSNYAYLPTMGTGINDKVLLDGGRLPYVTMPGILADDLTWTKPRTIGFGVETAALNNRLKFEYDWFQRTVFDQQGPAEQYSEVLGTAPPKRNNAVSETRGWELMMSWSDRAFNLTGAPIRYSVRAGVSDYIGYVVEYESNETGVRNNTWTPGQVFGELYGYTYGGIGTSAEDFQNTVLWRNGWFYPGDFNFSDTNGDGLVNTGQGGYWYAQGDRKFLGYTYPRYKYHIALNASWKGLTVSALFDGVGKQKVYTRNKYVMVSRNFYTVQQAELGGTWNLNNKDAFFPRSYDKNYNQIWERNANDKYVHNLAHLRIKNINLSYKIPTSIVSKLRLRSLSVNISGENLGMIYYKSWAKHYDPIQFEKNFATYPPSRIFSLGVKVGI